MRSLRLTSATVALLCAAVAVLAAALSVVATTGWPPNPTALVDLATTDGLAPVARATDPGFVLVGPQRHYDGVYYYAIARDPLLRGTEHTKIDQAAYRYGHPMYGWLARIVSLGNDRWIPAAMLLLSLVGIGLAAWATSRLSVHFGRTPWGGLLVAASPGLLFAATVSTTECVAAALLTLALLAWLRARLLLAGVLLVLLCLTKEQYVAVPLGLALWEAAQARRARRWPRDVRGRAVALVAGPVVLADWYVYVHGQLGRWPSEYQPGNLGAPFVGWYQAFAHARQLAAGTFAQSEIGTTAIPLLVAVAVVLVAAFVKALRLRTPLDGIVLGLVAVTACMGWLTLVYPHELVRNPAVTLLVALGVLLVGPQDAVNAAARERQTPAGTPSDVDSDVSSTST